MFKNVIKRCCSTLCVLALLLTLVAPCLFFTASATTDTDALYVWIPAEDAVASVLRSLGVYSVSTEYATYFQNLLDELLSVLMNDYFDSFTYNGETYQVLKCYRTEDGRLSFPAALMEDVSSLLVDGSDDFEPLVTSGFYPSSTYFSRYYAAINLLESRYKTSSPAIYDFIKNEAVYCTVTYLSKGSPGKVNIWWHNEPVSVDNSFVITGKYVSTYVSVDSPTSLYFYYNLTDDTKETTDSWNPNAYTYLAQENIERSVVRARRKKPIWAQLKSPI